MARDRFGDLERIYDALNLANVDPTTLPQNLDFVKYTKWRRGDTESKEITRPDLQGTEQIGLQAFGLGVADDNGKIIVSSNKRAVDFLNSLSFKAKFKLVARDGATPPTLTDYVENSGFVPAMARIRKTTGTTPVAQTSAITGRKYKAKASNNYSLPMGQGATARGFQEAILDILESINADTTLSASFKSEEWRRD